MQITTEKFGKEIIKCSTYSECHQRLIDMEKFHDLQDKRDKPDVYSLYRIMNSKAYMIRVNGRIAEDVFCFLLKDRLDLMDCTGDYTEQRMLFFSQIGFIK